MTRTATRPTVTATTATNAPVSRAWNECGTNRSALGKRVPDAADRLDEGRVRRVVLELVAEVAHVDVDRLLVLVEGLVVAEQVEELGTRIDPPGAAREVPQDLELGRREADPALAPLDPPPIEIDDQIAVPDDAAADGIGEVPVGAP